MRSREDDWKLEREELLKKQIELERLTGDNRSPRNNGNQPDNDAEQILPPIHAELNRVDWVHFKARSPGEGYKSKERFVLDVLMCEPVVSFERPVNTPWFSKDSSHSLVISRGTHKLRNPTAAPKQVSVPIQGQAPLPERIRINSKYIIKILETIHEPLLLPNESVTIIRPYKSLVYYDEPIRQKFRELEEKFAPQISSNGEIAMKTSDGNEVGDDIAESAEVGQGGQDSAANKSTEEEELTSCLTAYQHLKCLVEFMDDDIRKKTEYLESNSCQTVSFSDIWYLFKPGDEVIEQNRRQAYRVLRVTSSIHRAFPPWSRTWGNKEQDRAEEETPVTLHCVYIDFDGKQLGPITRKVRIARFDGEKAITSLEVFPLRFVETKRNTFGARNLTFRKKLIDRGQMFLDMAGFKHMHYSGLTLNTREEVDSHVVVDFEEAFSANRDSDWMPDLQNLITPEQEYEVDEDACHADCCKHDTVHQDAYAEKKRYQCIWVF